MKRFTQLLALTLLFGFTLVGAAFAQKETRNVDSFNRIGFGISGNLYIKQGSTQKVVLEGDDLDEIETTVSNGRLRIKYESNNWSWFGNRDKIDVYITVTDLEELDLSGSGRVYGESTIRATELDLDISGSGRMELEIDAEDLSSSISGSGSLHLSGESGSNKVSISGSGSLKAEDLMAASYSIRISGSGSCRINVSDEIDARVSGSGSIYYKGSPNKVNSSASGSGKVRKID